MEEVKIVEVEVSRLIFDETAKTPVIILREKGGKRLLPIWIGQFEANAIAFALEGVKAERPLTHDLITHILEGVGAKVEKIVINELKNNTFYARIVLRMDNSILSIDARPSDSIALALRVNAPIFVAESVLMESGTTDLT